MKMTIDKIEYKVDEKNGTDGVKFESKFNSWSVNNGKEGYFRFWQKPCDGHELEHGDFYTNLDDFTCIK